MLDCDDVKKVFFPSDISVFYRLCYGKTPQILVFIFAIYKTNGVFQHKTVAVILIVEK